MKRRMAALLWAALILCLTVGCTKTPGPSVPSSSGAELPTEPIALDALTVEFAAVGSPADLMALAGRMPEKLKAALAQAGVEVGRVQVTIGASPAATAQAVTQGGVDLAFLTAEDYVEAKGGGVPLLADAGPVFPGESDTAPGQTALLCTAPTEFGKSLARRAASGPPLTWEELERANWGVLGAESNLGYRYPALWLADGYEGDTLSDLRHVTTYQSYEELLRAAAAGEIDLFPSTDTALADWAEAWTMDETRADQAGRRGFGREAPLSEEIAVIGTTERCLTHLAVVREDEILASPQFTAALVQALTSLEADGDLTTLTACTAYAPLGDTTLDPLRRLLTLEGVA